MIPEASNSEVNVLTTEIAALKEQVVNLTNQLEQERNLRIQAEERLKVFESKPKMNPPPPPIIGVKPTNLVPKQ